MLSEVGVDKTKKWLDQDMLGCLNKFFYLANTVEFIRDPEVSWLRVVSARMLSKQVDCNGVMFVFFLKLADKGFVRAFIWSAPH